MTLNLVPYSETRLDYNVPDGYPVSCPTLELCATWASTGKSIYVHRPPGQIISKIQQSGQPGTTALDALAVTWDAHGQFLAIGWSDGFVRLMGLENNKPAHHIDVCSKTMARISHIGWACCNITNRPSNALSKSENGGMQGLSSSGSTSTADLPREIDLLEIETALPKISPLPGSSAGTGDDAIVFTLRTSIDFLFQTPPPEEYDKVNVMIVGSTDGRLHLSICDSFVIGSIPSPTLRPGSTPHLIKMASHPELSTQALLMASHVDRPDELHLLPIDLPFISSDPINLSLLASKLTALQKLLRYLRQTQLHMQFEWKDTRELPSRFVSSLEAGLEEISSGPRNVVAALLHTVVTGHAHEPVREWLVDSLAERGHKRWEKAVVTGLEALRSLVHENFIPALKRCSIILSRLKGLAQFHDEREDIGFTVNQITKVMDVISCLDVVGHKILLAVMDELEHFKSFSAWLRFQIDRLQSTNDEELTEKEATMDIGRVLTYIEKYIVDSPLRIYFGATNQEDRDAASETLDQGAGMIELLTAELDKCEKAQDYVRTLPHVDFLMDCAMQWANSMFQDIAETKKRGVRFGRPVSLSIGQKIDNLDICMRQREGGCSVYVALASREESNLVHILRVDMTIENGISIKSSVERRSITLGDRKLVDVKFLEQGRGLVVSCESTDDNPVIVFGSLTLLDTFHPLGPDSGPTLEGILSISDLGFPVLHIPREQSWRPVTMEVHEAADVRGRIPLRICFLGNSRARWHTFTLPQDGGFAELPLTSN